MQPMIATAVRFGRDERGGVLPLVGLCLTVILGFAALAIDLSHESALKTQLQATADAAALAAAALLPDQSKARSMALDYAEKNMPPAENGTVLAEDDIQFGTWYTDTHEFVTDATIVNAVKVTVRRSVKNGNPAPTFFSRIFGKDHADLAAVALAGVTLFSHVPTGGLDQLSEDDQAKLTEMMESLSEEARYRWEKSNHDPDEQMSETEAAEFLMEEYGKAVLLK